MSFKEKIFNIIKKIIEFSKVDLDKPNYQKIIFRIIKVVNYNLIKKYPYLLKKLEFLSVQQRIIMKKEELELIKKYLDLTDIVLEWGCGGSTILFSKYVKKYYSIEHAFPWYYKIKQLVPKNVVMTFVPPNSNKKNLPIEFQFKDYIKKVNNLKVSFFNKVLIDGRARTWCAEEVLLYVNEDSVIFIHDFYSRPRYHGIFKFYKEVDGIKDLIVLKKKITY